MSCSVRSAMPQHPYSIGAPTVATTAARPHDLHLSIRWQHAICPFIRPAPIETLHHSRVPFPRTPLARNERNVACVVEFAVCFSALVQNPLKQWNGGLLRQMQLLYEHRSTVDRRTVVSRPLIALLLAVIIRTRRTVAVCRHWSL